MFRGRGVNAIKGYLLGRSKRGEYWGGVLLLMLVAGIVGALGYKGLSNFIGFAGWCPIAIRRLRAIDWSPWLCLLPVGGGFAIGVLLSMVRTIVPGLTVETTTIVAKVIAVIATWAFIIYLGARPSRKEAARLDEAPRLAEVFD